MGFFFDVVTWRIGYGVGFAYFEDVTVVVALHVDVNGVVGGPGGDADFWFRHDGGFNWSSFTWEISRRNYSGFGLLLLKGRIAQQLQQMIVESNSVWEILTKERMREADIKKVRVVGECVYFVWRKEKAGTGT